MPRTGTDGTTEAEAGACMKEQSLIQDIHQQKGEKIILIMKTSGISQYKPKSVNNMLKSVGVSAKNR